ncbi:thiamine pyrophosphokinase [Suillus discolor]|uniref:Thiamine pyrophosphokinase n=1 Tax=Suillus discolor TaxID=1912936 RepID=A0A9P7F6N2_9AGAM|nr:thiamine pyrophosphokinase [Suillus discolor]KAG2107299.1 thiamine pyrophosphokinase [Suillus discolor]
MIVEWCTQFLDPRASKDLDIPRALIILNQPFSVSLLKTLWAASEWRSCADGGGNRLYDVLGTSGHPDLRNSDIKSRFLPDMVKGDFDSLRDDVRLYYTSLNVPVIHDSNQDSTDLMKCVQALEEKERLTGREFDIVILGGLSGRLDQTVHTLSYLHKLRKTRKRVFTVTDDNVGWVLDEGEHLIHINHDVLGQTCGLLPVGIDSTILTTTGLRWNLDNTESSFDGLVSTSNHLVPGQDVTIKTSKPIWWCAELREH